MTDEDIAEIMNKMWDAIDSLRGATTLMQHHHAQENKLMREEIDALKRQNAALVAQDTLAGGLLPPIREMSMLEAQVFHRETLTPKQKQGGYTHWSLRLRASVNGKKIKKEINVALFSGNVFAEKVFNTSDDVPPAITHFAESVRSMSGNELLLGMFKQYTSGAGSPRSRRQFAVLSGHLEERPVVAIWVDDEQMEISKFGPGKGTKATRSKWYGVWSKGKATLS